MNHHYGWVVSSFSSVLYIGDTIYHSQCKEITVCSTRLQGSSSSQAGAGDHTNEILHDEEDM